MRKKEKQTGEQIYLISDAKEEADSERFLNARTIRMSAALVIRRPLLQSGSFHCIHNRSQDWYSKGDTVFTAGPVHIHSAVWDEKCCAV
jgi:hypothetical protein